MKAKEGEFSIELDVGIIDLVNILKDEIENRVLSDLKSEFEASGKFPKCKPGQFDYNSAAALLVYIESMAFAGDTTRADDEMIH